MGFTTRPVIMGRRGVVTAGHYLSAEAGMRIMTQGGNAIDAAAAMCICVNLLEPQSNGIGGEVPSLIYSAKEGKTYAVSGMGWSPKDLTIDWCRDNGVDMIPGDGYLPACAPAVVGTWAEALARFGTMSYSQVLAPALELAEGGFPMYEGLHNALVGNQEKFTEQYPTSGDVYLPGGRVPEVGELFRNIDFANTLKTMCAAEESAKHMGRVAGIEAARDAFYKGEIAEKIAKFISTHAVTDETGATRTALLSYDDIAEWRATVEEPVSYNYKGLDVHKCPTWTQGPTFVQHLALLDGIDLKAMGHNTGEYLHTWVETCKLAFADREAYYGDPTFDDVPFDTLLSKQYNEARRGLVGPSASMDLRPGDVGNGIPEYALRDIGEDNRLALGMEAGVKGAGQGHHLGDTTHLDAVDIEGNMVAATPSGGWIGTSPLISELGFPIGTRGQMFYLNPERPNALQPRKRPRATLTPSMVTRNGRPWMAFGTPGGDGQEQWTVQFFLNYVEFGMNIQEALDAPTLVSTHFPSSFYPRESYPGRVTLDPMISSAAADDLRRRGHDLEMWPEPYTGGKVMGIRIDEERGVIQGGAAPKGSIGYAIGW